MSWLTDSKVCLNVAKMFYDSVEKSLNKDLNEEELAIVKGLIKSLLEQCRSPLDYIANAELATYYSGQTGKDIYFPMCRNKKGFKNFMKNNFYNLKLKNPSLYNTLESVQPYHKQYSWMFTLRSLVNTNKHNNLTKQSKIVNLTNASFTLPGNNVFSGITIENCKVPISIGGSNITGVKTVESNPFIKDFSGEFSYEYYFSDINLPVLTTLNSIINGVESVMHKIYVT